MPNAKNMQVVYKENKIEGIKLVEKSFDAWLEGVQGDGSAMIYIEGNPYRVSARSLFFKDGSPLIDS